MQLCLVLPGLLWPRKTLYDTVYDLDLPSLARLLGYGRLAWKPSQPFESWLCHAFGIESAEPPAAALRLLGEGLAPGKAIWICADAAHLELLQSTLALTSVGSVDISAADASELTADLSSLLEPLGVFQLAAGGGGHLRLRKLADITTTPPSAAIGRSAGTVQLQGSEALLWRRISNEVQMLLHRHPVNERRERAGLPTINTLWFWGAGNLPPSQPVKWTGACSQGSADALIKGLTNWCHIAWGPLPPNCSTWLTQSHRHALLAIESLLPSVQQLDAMRWRDSLLNLERNWFSPLLSALRSGRIERVKLVGLGDEASVELTVTRYDSFRVWRKPMPLAEMSAP